MSTTASARHRRALRATPCEGHYSVRGITFTFAWDPGTPAGGNFTARWSLRDGELRLTRISGRDAVDHVLWGLTPFRRIR